ncbi:MAG: GNAT family N-acetyltransferase [Planctomycetota bacterium]
MIRRATVADDAAPAEIMFAAIHESDSGYTTDQRRAWAPERRSGSEWSERLAGQTVFVAEAGGVAVGFMSVASDGYVDLAYVRSRYQGRGLFRRLYRRVEDEAVREWVPRLWVHASTSAEPAFRAVGFSVVHRESVEVRGQRLDRFEMEKRLDADSPE